MITAIADEHPATIESKMRAVDLHMVDRVSPMIRVAIEARLGDWHISTPSAPDLRISAPSLSTGTFDIMGIAGIL